MLLRDLADSKCSVPSHDEVCHPCFPISPSKQGPIPSTKLIKEKERERERMCPIGTTTTPMTVHQAEKGTNRLDSFKKLRSIEYKANIRTDTTRYIRTHARTHARSESHAHPSIPRLAQTRKKFAKTCYPSLNLTRAHSFPISRLIISIHRIKSECLLVDEETRRDAAS